jgi:hypothetical protein
MVWRADSLTATPQRAGTRYIWPIFGVPFLDTALFKLSLFPSGFEASKTIIFPRIEMD